jgi:hypothetical protein
MWRYLAAMAMGFGLLAVIVVVTEPSRFVAGLIVGVTASVLVGFILLLFLMTNGNVFTLAGIWAEGFVRDEIKAAKKAGNIWGGIDNIEIGGFDIDHLVFAPGGVFAIETKSHGIAFNSARLQNDLQQARDAARKASLILRSKHVEMPEEVIPVLAIWGNRFTEDLPDGGQLRDGVQVLAVRDLSGWLSHYAQGQIAQDNANEAMWRLTEFKDTRVIRKPSL